MTPPDIPCGRKLIFQGLVNVSKLDAHGAQLNLHVVDRAEQRSQSQHIVLTPEGTRFYPVSIRWAYPAELDLMARIAGLRPRDRWSGWDKQPFTKTSGKHVSVYELSD